MSDYSDEYIENIEVIDGVQINQDRVAREGDIIFYQDTDLDDPRDEPWHAFLKVMGIWNEPGNRFVHAVEVMDLDGQKPCQQVEIWYSIPLHAANVITPAEAAKRGLA